MGSSAPPGEGDGTSRLVFLDGSLEWLRPHGISPNDEPEHEGQLL